MENDKYSFRTAYKVLSKLYVKRERTLGEFAELVRLLPDMAKNPYFLFWMKMIRVHPGLLPMYGTSAPQPPQRLELVLHLVMESRDCDALVGDLEQRYRKLHKRLGKRNADVWYTKQVLTSICPLLRAAVRRVGGSAVVSVLSVGLRVVGLGGVADELKRALVKERRVGPGGETA